MSGLALELVVLRLGAVGDALGERADRRQLVGAADDDAVRDDLAERVGRDWRVVRLRDVLRDALLQQR